MTSGTTTAGGAASAGPAGPATGAGNSSGPAGSERPDTVRCTVDGRPVEVPKGTNLIDAAKAAGVDVPYYCYHPHLSVAGNCRMCQVQVKGQPKLTIGCNTVVSEGMEVLTHETSSEVADAQAATLEFILINHPLDCTVCDQAGHCKLQDYHYEYNARPSRFTERKEHKVKAVPLGPTVMLDGERCIMCTRCVRFCDEVTGTSELGMLNRGDRSVIAVSEGRPLDNPLSGTVVDLCPVGALTHREWRFNTRIWFTTQADVICPGCSTGCNSRAASRDGQIVQVKGRRNDDVNKEWMCDEGRYGFDRFLPAHRVVTASVDGAPVPLADAYRAAVRTSYPDTLVVLAPDLLYEDYVGVKRFLAAAGGEPTVVVAYRGRTLSPVEAILVSPDRAANFRGAELSGVTGRTGTDAPRPEEAYDAALKTLLAGGFRRAVFVGDRSVPPDEVSEGVLSAVRDLPSSVALLTDLDHPLLPFCSVVLPVRSVLEKSGLLVNRAGRVQYTEKVVEPPAGTVTERTAFSGMTAALGSAVTGPAATTPAASAPFSDREATLDVLATDPLLSGIRLSAIRAGGIALRV